MITGQLKVTGGEDLPTRLINEYMIAQPCMFVSPDSLTHLRQLLCTAEQQSPTLFAPQTAVSCKTIFSQPDIKTAKNRVRKKKFDSASCRLSNFADFIASFVSL